MYFRDRPVILRKNDIASKKYIYDKKWESNSRRKQFHLFIGNILSKLLLPMERAYQKIFNRGTFTADNRLQYLEFRCQKWQFSIKSLYKMAYCSVRDTPLQTCECTCTCTCTRPLFNYMLRRPVKYKRRLT